MDENVGIAVQLQWVGDMVSPPVPVNQILVVGDNPPAGSTFPDAHVLNFGFVSPPAISAELTPDQITQIQSQPLPVMPVGRFVFTVGRLRELRDVIDRHLSINGGQQ